jgi:Predicted phage phi-C31 gp36 major capsid-like protein
MKDEMIILDNFYVRNKQHDDIDSLIKETNSVLKDLSIQVKGSNSWKQRYEELESRFVQRGFPLPHGNQDDEPVDLRNLSPDERIKLETERTLERMLVPDKKYVPTKSKLRLISEWTLDFIKCITGDVSAQIKYQQKYAPINKATLDSDSYAVPDVVSSEILNYAYEDSVALQECHIVNMTSNKQSFPLMSGVTLAWGSTTSESTPTCTEVELETETLSAYSAISLDTFEDSAGDLGGWLTKCMAAEMGQELDNQLFNGTGDPCSGILTAKCGFSASMGTGSASFSMIGAVNLSEMISKLSGVRKRFAKYVVAGDVLHFIRTLKDDQARPIFQGTISEPTKNLIWGYGYRESPEMPSTSSSSTAFLIFGDFRNGALIGKRVQGSSLEINRLAETPFLNNRIWLKHRSRFAIDFLPEYFCRLLTSAE